MIYILHFDRPLKHAQHYLGFAEDGNFEKRIQRHMSGRGSKLMRAVMQAGIPFAVARKWEGPEADRNLERKFHRRNNTKRLCPICTPESAA